MQNNLFFSIKSLNVARIILALTVLAQLLELSGVTTHYFPDTTMFWGWIVYQLVIWAVFEVAAVYLLKTRGDHRVTRSVISITSLALVSGIVFTYLGIISGAGVKYIHFDQFMHFFFMGVIGSLIVTQFVRLSIDETRPFLIASISFTVMMALNSLHEIAEYVGAVVSLRQYPELYDKLITKSADVLDTWNDLFLVMCGSLIGIALTTFFIHRSKRD